MQSIIERVNFYLTNLDPYGTVLAVVRVPSKYKGYNIKVVDHAPDTGKSPFWIGIWDFDKNLQGTIYLERQYIEASRNKNSSVGLKETLQHEVMEAELAKAEVIKNHGPLEEIPYKKRKKLLDKAGAEAHHTVVTNMHPGWTEPQYLKHLETELKNLDL